MSLSLTRFASRLRFTLLTATLLFVLSLNHQAVATLHLRDGSKAARVGAATRVAVVKKKVTFEGTTPLGLWLAPVADAWPFAPESLFSRLRVAATAVAPRVRPGALTDFFRMRLLRIALSPHAP